MEILIIKLSAIGDVVHSLPFLEVLKGTFPRAHIDWVVEEPADEIIQGHSMIRQVLVSPRRSLVNRFREDRKWLPPAHDVQAFVNQVRSREYDLIIDLQGLFKSGIITGLSKGKRKIGMSGSREGARLFLSEPPVRVDYDRHAVDRYLQIASYLGARLIKWEGRIPVSEADRESLGRKLVPYGLDAHGLVAINPMAKWTTKCWDLERFALLADKIAAEFPFKVVFTGSMEDRSIVSAIINMMNREACNFAGETTLKELSVLYEKCRLLITTDTGPMHMASAMGCPVMALFGPTAPWRTGPYGAGHQIIRDPIVCSPCFKRGCIHQTCMREITPDQVFKSVRAALNEAVSTSSTNAERRKSWP
ncbi:MAG: glycosyltransferase family 9 protein [Deltaproteobacteria bacterium]|nr:glycosyltransferase family 9 protein [Deltaproteobacteria bacterium]